MRERETETETQGETETIRGDTKRDGLRETAVRARDEFFAGVILKLVYGRDLQGRWNGSLGPEGQ